MFSIIIPTFNNFNYLKICIESIKKNSKFNHQIIVHVNEGRDQTLKYLQLKKIAFTYTKNNVGLCKGVNMAAKIAKKKYIVYSHDDFYFCPLWDKYFLDEIKKIKHNKFYISGTMTDTIIRDKFDCGNTYKNFNEFKFLNNFKKTKYKDLQGSTWAPHIVETKLWNRVGGFSEEFFPGAGSDPDLAMKLWKCKVRIFKSLGKCVIYHFGSKTLRGKLSKSLTANLGSKSSKIFLLKWGISIKFFRKHYLKSDTKFDGFLKNPKKNLFYYFDLFKCKLTFIFHRFLSSS